MYDKYLPLGSIVVLKDSIKKIMITGFGMMSNNKVYDYAGCVYPSGYSVLNETNLFNHDDIDNILFLGYRTLEQEKHKERIIAQSLNHNINNNKINEENINIEKPINNEFGQNNVENQNIPVVEPQPIVESPVVESQPIVNNTPIDVPQNNQMINNYPENPAPIQPIENSVPEINQTTIDATPNIIQPTDTIIEQNQNNVSMNAEQQKPSSFAANLFGGMFNNNSNQNSENIDQNIPVTPKEADEMFKDE